MFVAALLTRQIRHMATAERILQRLQRPSNRNKLGNVSVRSFITSVDRKDIHIIECMIDSEMIRGKSHIWIDR